MSILYFIIAIAATTVGALTGMGGGVILKPVLDLMGNLDAATINILSSVAVFCMTVVSIGRQMQQKVKIDFKLAIPLAVGSVAGGNAGQLLLAVIIRGAQNRTVVLVQNAILAGVIVIVFFYMVNKEKIPPLKLRGIVAEAFIGLLLGVLSSFLGIGGGPINVALLIFVFAMDTKSATIFSLITIFFAQAAKLISLAVAGGFYGCDFSGLLPLTIGAVAGGLIGSTLNKKLPVKSVETAFNGVQLVVLAICLFNIFKFLQ